MHVRAAVTLHRIELSARTEMTRIIDVCGLKPLSKMLLSVRNTFKSRASAAALNTV
jgi:hypothetical protein